MKNIVSNASAQVKDKSRSVLLVSLGVIATVSDQYDKVFETLVEKGRGVSEKRESDKQETKSEFVLTAKTREVTRFIGDRFQGGVTRTLGRLGIPSQTEITELTRSIELLTEKVTAMATKSAA